MSKALFVAAACVLVANSGCADAADDAGAEAEAAGPSPPILARAPEALVRACEHVAVRSRLVVRCPRRVPAAIGRLGRLRVAPRDFAPGSCAFMINLEGGGAGIRGYTRHLIAGGAPRYSLRTVRGRWPARLPLKDPLRLIPERPLKPGQTRTRSERVQVAATRGGPLPRIVLRMPSYPLGGLHGNHLVLLLNRENATYIVSVHAAAEGRNATAELARELLVTGDALSVYGEEKGGDCPGASSG